MMQDISKIKNLINKNICYLLGALLLLYIFGPMKFMIPEINKLKDQKQQSVNLEAQVKALKERIKPKEVERPGRAYKNAPVTIYSSPYPDLDVESAAVDLVDQFIIMIRDTQNRIVEISFNTKPNDTTVPANVLSLNMTLNSSYASFQKLLQKVYTWKYLAAIKDIAVSPVQGDPNNLDIRLTVDLYVK